MRPILRVSLLLLVAISALGQSIPGAAFPLTNTRYGERGGFSRLVTDGKDFYLFWTTESNIRMTRLVDGEARAGRAVMPVDGNAGTFDVIFTGRYFLVATGTGARTIRGRLVSTEGEPAGDPFPLSPYWSESPRLAFNGKDVLMVHRSRHQLAVTRLTAEGRPLGAARAILAYDRAFDVASNGDSFAVVVASPDGDRLVILDAAGATRSEQSLGGRSRSVRIASDGHGYRAAGVAVDDRAWSCTFEPNGALDTTVTLGDASDVASLIWTGSAYKAALRRDTLRVIDLDRGSGIFAEAAPVPFAGQHLNLAALGNRVLAAWFSWPATVTVSPLPLTPDSGVPAAFGAAEQRLLATATSRDAALVAWTETATDGSPGVHLGLRRRDGSWVEGRRTDIGERLVAASDGHDFLLLYVFNNAWYARRIDSAGRSVSAAAAIDPRFTPEDMLWNGRSFVAVGLTAEGHVAAAEVSANGVVSAPVRIARSDSDWKQFETPVVATDGSEFLVAWVVAVQGLFPPATVAYSIHGAHLSADLTAGRAFTIAEYSDQGKPGLAWDGTNYVAAWSDEAVRVRRISADGVPLGLVPGRFWDGVALPPVHVMTSDRGVTLTWRSNTFNYYTTELNRRNGDGFGGTIFLRAYAGNAPHAMPLPDGRAAILAPVPLDEPPFHGSRRITMTVLDHVWPRKPLTAPDVTVRLVDGRFRIEWTTVAETVTGYRVEYRIGDGNWNELERSPDPSNRSATFRPPRAATAYAFRVRAMSDGGMGPYSDPAAYYPGKRRAVR